MKRFSVLFQHKSNKCILLCTLLLFLFSIITFSPAVLHATELPAIPMETVPFPPIETPVEPEPNTPIPTEAPEEILTEESIPSVPSTIETPLPEPSTSQPPPDSIIPPILPPADDTPTAPTEESFTIEVFDGTYYVTSSGGLNVRSGPSIQYDIIGNLPYAVEISVTGKVQDDWFEIPFQGTAGYISAKYLSLEPPSTLSPEAEEIPETLETITEEPVAEQESVPFISDTTMTLLLLAIVAMIIIIIITVISFFRNNHKYS